MKIFKLSNIKMECSLDYLMKVLETDKVYWSLKLLSLKEFSKMIKKRKGHSKMLMAFIGVTLTMIWEKEREDINGIMDKFSKVNGNREKRMDLDYGVLQMEIVTKDFGLMAVNRVEELILTKIASIKESFITA